MNGATPVIKKKDNLESKENLWYVFSLFKCYIFQFYTILCGCFGLLMMMFENQKANRKKYNMI